MFGYMNIISENLMAYLNNSGPFPHNCGSAISIERTGYMYVWKGYETTSKLPMRVSCVCAITGISSHLGGKLREAGCYSWAALSSNDSKTRYIMLKRVYFMSNMQAREGDLQEKLAVFRG